MLLADSLTSVFFAAYNLSWKTFNVSIFLADPTWFANEALFFLVQATPLSVNAIVDSEFALLTRSIRCTGQFAVRHFVKCLLGSVRLKSELRACCIFNKQIMLLLAMRAANSAKTKATIISETSTPLAA